MYSRQYKTAKASAKNFDPPAKSQFAPPRVVVQPQVQPTPQNPDVQAQSERVEQSGQGINPNLFKYHPPRQPRGIQMKLSIGQPGDKYEQEADKVAADVVHKNNAPESEEVQRMDAPEEEELQMKPMVQRLPVENGMAASKVKPIQTQENAQLNQNIIQRIADNGVAVDIDTLDLDQARNHLSRMRRIRGMTNAGKALPSADVPYTYDPADEAALQLRVQTLEAQELENKRLNVVADLVLQLANLATVADWTDQPVWAGTTPTAADGGETIGSTVQPANVVARWVEFLGSGPYSHKHPRTGNDDPTRLVSADGQRSIRYGNHERNSPAKQHHFHEETWTYDATNTTLTVTNVLRRSPVSL
ncbi:hypothetical protein [Anabaena sp. CCY 0017]|uniref:hypothetical protein n=1 Tax=Anabaena sp. CCY 0017 TaxID=3103866 RepID=UPI0039C6EEED